MVKYIVIIFFTEMLGVKDMAHITKEDMMRTADLARLAITEEEAEMYSEQISSILTFTEKLNEINTDDVKPTTNGNLITNVLRADEPKQYITREEALNNAPEHEGGQFKVPAIME